MKKSNQTPNVQPAVGDFNGQKVCPHCNAVIPAQAMYCPNCAQPLPPTAQPVKKKGKGKKIAIVIVSVILVIALGLGGGAWYIVSSAKKNYSAVVENLDAGETAKAEAAYQKLNFYGIKKYRDDIIKKFVETVRKNQYVPNTNSEKIEGLIDYMDVIDPYIYYRNFASLAEITEADGTNVVSHINAVIELAEYSKYNVVIKACNKVSEEMKPVYKYLNAMLEEVNELLFWGNIPQAYIFVDAIAEQADAAISELQKIRYTALEFLETEHGYYGDESDELVNELVSSIENMISAIEQVKSLEKLDVDIFDLDYFGAFAESINDVVIEWQEKVGTLPLIEYKGRNFAAEKYVEAAKKYLEQQENTSE